MITLKNPALVSVTREGSAWFYPDSCCKTNAGAFDMGKVKHGLWKHPLFNRWQHIKYRCYYKSAWNYCNYGGRGITMCDEWKASFKSFYDYMMGLPNAMKGGYSLDRINNNGNYEPENMKWSTGSEQSANRRKRSDNKSGYIGVSMSRDKWRSGITVNKQLIRLGNYSNKKDAVNARNNYIIENNLTEYKIQ